MNFENNKSYDEAQSEVFETKLDELSLKSAVILSELDSLDKVLGSFGISDQSKSSNHRVRVALVAGQEGELKGIFTERDLILKGLIVKPEFYNSRGEIKLAEWMTSKIFTLRHDDTVSTAIKLMAIREFRHIPVDFGEGLPISERYKILSIRDLLNFIVNFFPRDVKALGTKKSWNLLEANFQEEGFSFCPKSHSLSGNIFYSPLRKAIYRDALRIDHNTSLHDTLIKMAKAKTGYAVITEFETIIKGIFTESDIVEKVTLLKNFGELELKVKDFMTASPDTLLEKHLISHAINNMFEFKYRRIIIVNEDNFPISIVSLLDILKFISHALLTEGSSG